MLVRDVATAPAVLCQADATIAQVAREMREQDVGSVIVVDEHARLAGVITDRDRVPPIAVDSGPAWPAGTARLRW